MRVCAQHFSDLIDALKAKGLGSLFCVDEEDANRRFISVTLEGLNTENFDPVLLGQYFLAQSAVATAGMSILQPNKDGSERCPICYLNEVHRLTCTDKECHVTFTGWVVNAADDVLNRYRLLGENS